MIFLLFHAITVKSAYYIGFTGFNIHKYVTKCDTRDALVDEINSMDLSFQRLPTIIIDEDLELDCNELPMFYYKVATLHRDNTFPSYTIMSNSTDGFSTFTLDTTTNSDDNCPGFSFMNVTVIFKGKALNTSIMSIGDGVSITSDPGFKLRSTISEIPLNFLPVFPNLSFCRLTVLPEISTADSLNYFGDIELNLENKYAEAYMFSIDISESTDVLFGNNQMSVDIYEKIRIVVHFPEVINYSNSFYFNIIRSKISLTIAGDINYTDQFPHYLYIYQDLFTSRDINITLNPGNYFTHEGTCFNNVAGEKFSLTLSESNLFWNNPTPLMAIVLSFSNLYLFDNFDFTTSTIYNTNFAYYSDAPIYGNINISCNTLSMPYHVEPYDGCFLNITAKQTTDSVDFNGDLYITSSISNDVIVSKLFFFNEPLINLGSNRSPIKCKEVYGKARISPVTAGVIGNLRTILCASVVDTMKVENFIIESDYDGAFQPIIYDGCICVNKTKSTIQNPTINIPNEEFNWKDSYESFQKKITFSFSTQKYVLDLTVFSSRKQPVSIVFQTSRSCAIEVKIDQKSADKIESIQIGSSTTPMNISWPNGISLHCDIIVYKCCDLLSLFKGLNLENMGTITLKDFSQLKEIESVASNFNAIVLSTTEKVKNLTYTSTGWRVYTSDLPENEELFIKGFNHPNILLSITSMNAFGPMFGRMMNVGLETTNPFPLYISFSTNLIVYLLGNEKWEDIEDFYPIILVTGVVTLMLPIGVLPLNFNDDKFGTLLNRMPTRKVTIDRTSDHIQSIISVNSPFNLKYSFEIEIVNIENNLYIEINKEATIHGAATITHSDSIFIVFRDKLIMDSASSQRMWRESNSIYMYNTSTLLSPSFMDEIFIVWNCSEKERNKPSMIESAINTNHFTFQFADVSDKELSGDFEKFFDQPFQVANSIIDIDCDELVSRLTFVDGIKSFNFLNKTISFEVICTDLIYATHPVTFTLAGYQASGFPSHIALFLNRSMKDDDGLNDKNKGKTKLDPGVIVCIIIGASTVAIIVVSLSVYFIKRRKHSIEYLVNYRYN